MSVAAALSDSAVPPKASRAVIGVIAVWFVVVIGLGAAGAFVARPGAPPLAIALGAGIPLAAFFIAVRVSEAFS